MQFTKPELYALLNQPGPHYLRGADLSGADLRDADLRDANLRDANLTGANLEGADLTGALMQGAQLAQANLVKANINRSVFNTAKYCESTKWPAGFKPESKGAKLEATFKVVKVPPRTPQEAATAKAREAAVIQRAFDRAIAKAEKKPAGIRLQRRGQPRP